MILSRAPDCPFCIFDHLRPLDELIYTRAIGDGEVQSRTETTYKTLVTIPEIRNHRRHLLPDEPVTLDLKKREADLIILDESSTLEIAKARINALRLELAKMELNRQTNKAEYSALTSRLKELLELRSKLEGKIVEKSEVKLTFAELAKRLEPQTSTSPTE